MRFAAFSFVDQIVEVEVGKSIVGNYNIPDSISNFSHALCCESVGQCAAFSAMAALDFQYQPVAGISQAVEFYSLAKPGQRLNLEAQIIRADSEAVTYDGRGLIDGQEVVVLHGCLGPMLPMSEFDDPENLRSRFEVLTQGGAEPNKFSGVPEFEAVITEQGDESLVAHLQVPSEADFFLDHFPRKPVFPGTLFLDMCVRFAKNLVGPEARPVGAFDAKLREFMEPGAELDLEAKLVDSEVENRTEVAVFLKGRKRAKRMVKIGFEV